ncbi:MAG: hypothetical protein V7691_11580 [Galbibacter orientalis]|uniref:hypothetical protein n=1 Tax=Galbibacter orientalis TaxID=453852 RepID=UPI00300107F1
MKLISRNLLMMLIPTTILIVSCNDDDSNESIDGSPTEALTVEEVKTSMEATQVSDEVDDIVDYMVVSDLGSSSNKQTSTSSKGWLPDCYTISTEASGDDFMITLDFGEGCEMPDGRNIAGILTMTKSNVSDSTSFTRNSEVKFESFTIDSITVNGSKTYQHTFADDENPKTMVASEITLLWEDESTMQVNSEKTREWIEGFDDGEWGNSAFLVTGTTTVINKDGVTYTSEVTTPLRAELSCNYIVSGVLTLSKDEASAEVDFGDGTCDDKAMYSDPEGNTTEITLKK